MKTYQEYKVQLSEQLKGHHLRLFAILFFSSLLISLCKDSLVFVMDAKSLFYSIVSFCLSLFFSLVNYVILFLFIKRVRNEAFHLRDIRFGASRFLYLIAAGLLVSIVQLLVSTVATLLIMVPPLYYVGMSILNVFFILWNALIAYGVYDGVTQMKALVAGSFQLLWEQLRVILRGALVYMIWFVIAQVGILLVVQSFLGNGVSNNLMEMFTSAFQNTQALVSIVGIYLLYYVVQFYLLVPLYLLSANVYEDGKERWMR
ncbi:hypothetical protein MKC66_06535 [[Clostridium] innocuum]|nr:hypothetical protein [[Clostridium] innocuum]